MKLLPGLLLFMVASSGIFAQKTEISIATARGQLISATEGTQISLYNKWNNRVWAGAHFSFFYAKDQGSAFPVSYRQVQLGQKLNLLPKSRYLSIFIESGASFLFDREASIGRYSCIINNIGFFPCPALEMSKIFYPGAYTRTDLQVHLFPRVFVGLGAGLTFMPLLREQYTRNLSATDLSFKLGTRF